jgi:hypothetical protein
MGAVVKDTAKLNALREVELKALEEVRTIGMEEKEDMVEAGITTAEEKVVEASGGIATTRWLPTQVGVTYSRLEM